MFNDLNTAFLITVLGMGIVFAAIIILWISITVLVNISNRFTSRQSANVDRTTHLELKRRAAVAAVVVALSRQADSGLSDFPLPPTAFVSAWQAVMRSNIIRKRGNVR